MHSFYSRTYLPILTVVRIGRAGVGGLLANVRGKKIGLFKKEVRISLWLRTKRKTGSRQRKIVGKKRQKIDGWPFSRTKRPITVFRTVYATSCGAQTYYYHCSPADAFISDLVGSGCAPFAGVIDETRRVTSEKRFDFPTRPTVFCVCVCAAVRYE